MRQHNSFIHSFAHIRDKALVTLLAGVFPVGQDDGSLYAQTIDSSRLLDSPDIEILKDPCALAKLKPSDRSKDSNDRSTMLKRSVRVFAVHLATPPEPSATEPDSSGKRKRPGKGIRHVKPYIAWITQFQERDEEEDPTPKAPKKAKPAKKKFYSYQQPFSAQVPRKVGAQPGNKNALGGNKWLRGGNDSQDGTDDIEMEDRDGRKNARGGRTDG